MISGTVMEIKPRNVMFWDCSATSLCYNCFCTLLPRVTWIKLNSNTERFPESELRTEQPVNSAWTYIHYVLHREIKVFPQDYATKL